MWIDKSSLGHVTSKQLHRQVIMINYIHCLSVIIAIIVIITTDYICGVHRTSEERSFTCEWHRAQQQTCCKALKKQCLRGLSLTYLARKVGLFSNIQDRKWSEFFTYPKRTIYYILAYLLHGTNHAYNNSSSLRYAWNVTHERIHLY